VNLHLVGYGRLAKPELEKIPAQRGPTEDAKKEMRKVCFADEGWLDTPVYFRDKMGHGAEIEGPAIVEEVTASTVVCPGQRLLVDIYGNLIISVGVR
jgi:N-methylhydantoinase A